MTLGRWRAGPARSGPADSDAGSEERALLLRILVAVFWIPLQLTLSLLFASGAILFLLILGFAVGPFVGLFFLVRRLRRRLSGEGSTPRIEGGGS